MLNILMVSLRKILILFLIFISSIGVSLVILEAALSFGIIKTRFHDRLAVSGELSNPKCKIFILGDSFACCIHHFLLSQLSPYRVSVLNAATSGAGPFEYAMDMKTQGINFKPDVTILFYYVGNDLTGVQSELKKSGVYGNLKRNFIKRLHLYRLYKETKNTLFPKAFNYKKFSAYGIKSESIALAKSGKLNPWLLEASVKDKDYLADNILIETKDSMIAWEKTKELLCEIKELCNKINSQFVIIIFPSTVQVDRSHYVFYKNLGFNIDERMLFSDKPQRLLKDFCNDNNIAYLDLLAHFKREGQTDLYSENDDHLNKIGNAFSTKIITNFLLKNTILGDDLYKIKTN